jgi:hypothetical protein
MTKTDFLKARLEFYRLSAFVVAGFSIALVILQAGFSIFIPSMIAIAFFGFVFIYIGIKYSYDMQKLKELSYNE